jgi:hypothetical protein
MVNMAFKLTKDTSEVIFILNSILKEIKARLNDVEKDISNNFNLEIIQDTSKYCLDMSLLNMEEIIAGELEKLNWIDIIIDCGEIENDLVEIEEFLINAKENIKEDLQKIEDYGDFKIESNKITRKIHLAIPINWGPKNLEKYFKQFLQISSEKKIVAA